VINDYTYKLKISGYNRGQAKEIIVSGIRGFRNKVERRKREGQPFYRHAKKTLASRVKKKLLGKTSWYKDNNNKDDTGMASTTGPRSSGRRGGGGWQKHVLDKVEEDRKKNQKQRCQTKSVIFVPQTKNSELAKRLREHENEMEKHTGYRIKIVERSGRGLNRILTKSNPWGGEDCGREGCLLCQTKAAAGKNLTQSCTKRSVVYETWCALCMKREEETSGQEGGVYKYIGETAKSAFERGANHLYDRKNLDLGSHMLKHSIEHHEGVDPEDVTFHMKVLKYHRSSF
jgi:hypothetical protein